MAPVSGKVTFDGKPQAGIHVIFRASGDTKSSGGSGVTDAEGAFKIKNTMDQDGIPPGSYVVTFSSMAVGKDAAAPKDAAPIPGVTAVEKIPPKWSNPAKQGYHNQVTVPEGGKQDFSFAIPAK